jgi:RNA recognition motif-containing protein
LAIPTRASFKRNLHNFNFSIFNFACPSNRRKEGKKRKVITAGGKEEEEERKKRKKKKKRKKRERKSGHSASSNLVYFLRSELIFTAKVMESS